MVNPTDYLQNYVDEIVSSKLSLIMISNKEGSAYLANLIHDLKKRNDYIVYVGFVKTFQEIREILVKSGVDINGIYFIECSDESSGVVCHDNCCTLKSLDIESLLSEITLKLKGKTNAFLIFDTVSDFLMYEHKSTILKFTNSILSNEGLEKISTLYLVFKDISIKKEDHENLLNDLRMLTNKEITLN